MEKRIFIIFVILALFLTFGCTQKKPVATTTLGVVCNPPYIRVGNECCLDENGNSVCDSDEEVETTAETTVASTIEAGVQQTTSVQATSISTTSTSTIKYACSTNADCGDLQYGNTLCDGDNVMRQVTTFRCSKPGTANAKCIGSVKTEKVITCEDPNKCVGGKCVTESGSPVATTTLGCSWTQQSCITYCDESCSDRGMAVQSCEYDAVDCRCTATCGSQATTTPATTSTLPATTTAPGTTTTSVATTSTISVQCSGSLYNSNTCDGACDSDCEDCSLKQGFEPCYACEEKDCSTLGGALTLYNTLSECNQNNSDSILGYCTNWDECDHCYYFYLYECGNGEREPGEECEVGITCQSTHSGSGAAYLDCDLNDCLCYPDCIDYCDDQGVDGYNWEPNPATQAQCEDEMDNQMANLPAQCTTRCGAYAWYPDKNGVSCCCVDVNSLPCQNCPGQNPVCPSTDDCMATL